MELLARAGQTFRGQELTPEMIQDVAQTFNEVGRAPLTFGHPSSQEAPKAGNITELAASSDNTKLYGELEPLDKVQDAVDEGFFDDRSVGIARSADGEHYLHHVALLGGTPPAIKNMEPLSDLPIDFEDDIEVLHFGEDEDDERGLLKRLVTLLDDAFSSTDSTTEMSDSDSNDEPSTEDLMQEIEDLKAKIESDDDGAEPSGDGDDTDDFADSELKKEYERELERVKKDRRESEVQSVREAAKGKMPEEAVDQFADLAESLPDTINFSDDGEEKEKSPRQLLADALSDLPEMVETGPINLSDEKENGEVEGDEAFQAM